MDNKITLDLNVEQKGHIKVHTQIINDLSSGIYSSPASCIKELINNSYDADAKKVVIRIKPIQDSITVMDDGTGMNAEEFDSNFAWISKSNKRNEGDRSEILDRPLIGKIGIGFIAVNEICEELEVISSKQNEPFKFTSIINFKQYFDLADIEEMDEEERANAGIIKGEYTLINEEEDSDIHYTIVRLNGLKESVRKILDDKQYFAQKLKEQEKSYEKIFFDSMFNLLEDHNKRNARSFGKDNGYVQFIINLASYIPVEYIDGGPISGLKDPIIDSIVEYHKALNFSVDLDGIFLKKPTFFFADDEFRHLSFDDEIKADNGKSIKFKGYFFIQNRILFPKEFNGISVRIKSIPIAPEFGYDSTFLHYPLYMNQLFRNWISGEIFVEKGLEDAMNIDRASFRVTHPEYLALQDFLHRYLDEKVFPITLSLYKEGKTKRDTAKTKERKETQKKILDTNFVEFEEVKKPKRDASGQDEVSDFVPDSKAPMTILKSDKKQTLVQINPSIIKKFKKKDWEYLEDVFLIFETAYQEANGNLTKMRTLFYEKISNWKNIE